MSFYKGSIVKLVSSSYDPELWDVVDIQYIDTKCDENINIKFSHNSSVRAVFLPTTLVNEFDTALTKIVRRTFDPALGIECWQAYK